MRKRAEKMTAFCTLHSGQFTIPEEFRRELHLEDEGLLLATLDNGELRLKPIRISMHAEEEGSPWLKEFYEYFAPVRQEAIEKGYTEEEINAWIDQAIAEVRAEHRAKSR